FTMSEITHATSSRDYACETVCFADFGGCDACRWSPFGLCRARFAFVTLAAPREANGEAWWSQTGSNRRPPACKAGALPAELWPLQKPGNKYQASGCSDPCQLIPDA